MLPILLAKSKCSSLSKKNETPESLPTSHPLFVLGHLGQEEKRFVYRYQSDSKELRTELSVSLRSSTPSSRWKLGLLKWEHLQCVWSFVIASKVETFPSLSYQHPGGEYLLFVENMEREGTYEVTINISEDATGLPLGEEMLKSLSKTKEGGDQPSATNSFWSQKSICERILDIQNELLHRFPSDKQCLLMCSRLLKLEAHLCPNRERELSPTPTNLANN